MMRRLLLTGLVLITAMAGSSAFAAVTVTINTPDNNAVVNDNHTLVSGIATALGAGQGVDLMLVLDDSGSLNNTDPTKERFAAVRQLFMGFGPNADIRLGMVFFKMSATLAVPLQSVSTAESAANAAMDARPTPGGGTYIEKGISAAYQELQANGRSNASRVMLVFTDGNDASSQPELKAQQAAVDGIAVHVVWLSNYGGKQKLEAIARYGNGRFFEASQAAQLSALFRSAQLVNIDGVTVTNTTTSQAAGNVTLGPGTYSAPLDLVEGRNVIKVVAKDTDGNQATDSVTVTVPIKCLPRNVPGEPGYKPECPINPPPYMVKRRPQVLMAGFDPMLVDIGDDSFKVTAVVREGAEPIRHVTFNENTGSFSMKMDLEGDLPNGDKIYSLTFVQVRFVTTMELPNLFGSKPGEFNIRVTDEAQVTHAFPALESGNNVTVTRYGPLTTGTPYKTQGIKRPRPQALMAGFDPMLIDLKDDGFKVRAIVRRGTGDVKSVTLKTNDNLFAVAMKKDTAISADGDIGNGDLMYVLEYTFPRGAFPTGAFRDLFGGEYAGEFVVTVIDEFYQEHTFPALNVCNCPERP